VSGVFQRYCCMRLSADGTYLAASPLASSLAFASSSAHDDILKVHSLIQEGEVVSVEGGE
jgi:hypothetical protein